jgi:TRAP-type transport system periplasmic protein
MNRSTLTMAALATLLGASTAFAGPPPPPPPPPAKVVLRIATQAPEGTVWMDALEDIRQTVLKGTKGRVEFKFFPNGSMGEEGAIIEKTNQGMLHGGLFTGIGLGQISSKIRLLEVPFLYQDKAEIDAVKVAFDAEFKKGLDEEGFVFLGWAEVGWAYIFSKVKARNIKELRERKIWVWQADPLANKTFKAFGLSGVPLALPDVLTSLNTGMIDSVYNSPYGLVGLQWHRKVKFMSRMTVGHGTGALLVSKKAWDKIPAPVQARIKSVCKARLDRCCVEIEAKNEETIKELEENGTKIIPIPDDEMPMYKKLGGQVADSLVGELWDQDMLDRVRAIIGKLRKK